MVMLPLYWGFKATLVMAPFKRWMRLPLRSPKETLWWDLASKTSAKKWLAQLIGYPPKLGCWCIFHLFKPKKNIWVPWTFDFDHVSNVSPATLDFSCYQRIDFRECCKEAWFLHQTNSRHSRTLEIARIRPVNRYKKKTAIKQQATVIYRPVD